MSDEEKMNSAKCNFTAPEKLQIKKVQKSQQGRLEDMELIFSKREDI